MNFSFCGGNMSESHAKAQQRTGCLPPIPRSYRLQHSIALPNYTRDPQASFKSVSIHGALGCRAGPTCRACEPVGWVSCLLQRTASRWAYKVAGIVAGLRRRFISRRHDGDNGRRSGSCRIATVRKGDSSSESQIAPDPNRRMHANSIKNLAAAAHAPECGVPKPLIQVGFPSASLCKPMVRVAVAVLSQELDGSRRNAPGRRGQRDWRENSNSVAQA